MTRADWIKRTSRRAFLTDAELAAFMEAVRTRHHVNQPRDHAFFAVLANTGLRPSEASALARKDIHVDASPPWIRVTRMKKKKKTVRETDDLQIPAGLATILGAYCSGMDAETRLFPISRRTGARLFHYYAKRAGIKHGWLYVLRHTAATRLYRVSRDINLAQAILGHETPDMTALYAHVSRSLLREWANEAAPIT